jgi:hypothetical protein
VTRLKLVQTMLLAGIILLAGLALAKPAGAAPMLSILNIYGKDDDLTIDFYLKNAIDRDIIQSMKDGVPALLSYQVDVWLDRDNWYDKLVKSVRYSYRMQYDNWDTVYTVTSIHEDYREDITAGDIAELIHVVCNQLRMRPCKLSDLSPQSRYYIAITAEVQPLSAERVREIDNWLGGEDADESSGGMLDFVIGIFSSGGKSTEIKGSPFRPRDLRR